MSICQTDFDVYFWLLSLSFFWGWRGGDGKHVSIVKRREKKHKHIMFANKIFIFVIEVKCT